MGYSPASGRESDILPFQRSKIPHGATFILRVLAHTIRAIRKLASSMLFPAASQPPFAHEEVFQHSSRQISCKQ